MQDPGTTRLLSLRPLSLVYRSWPPCYVRASSLCVGDLHTLLILILSKDTSHMGLGP